MLEKSSVGMAQQKTKSISTYNINLHQKVQYSK